MTVAWRHRQGGSGAPENKPHSQNSSTEQSTNCMILVCVLRLSSMRRIDPPIYPPGLTSKDGKGGGKLLKASALQHEMSNQNRFAALQRSSKPNSRGNIIIAHEHYQKSISWGGGKGREQRKKRGARVTVDTMCAVTDMKIGRARERATLRKGREEEMQEARVSFEGRR